MLRPVSPPCEAHVLSNRFRHVNAAIGDEFWSVIDIFTGQAVWYEGIELNELDFDQWTIWSIA